MTLSLLLASSLIFTPMATSLPGVDQIAEAYDSAHVYTIPHRSNPSYGDVGADVKVQLFIDLECPHCQRTFEQLSQVLLETETPVEIIFHHFPLSSRCNPSTRYDSHPLACELHRGMWAAMQQSPYLAQYFVMQLADTSLTRATLFEQLVGIAEGVGLDGERFAEAMESSASMRAVRGDASMGGNLLDPDTGDRVISGTPTVFVNGRHLLRAPGTQAEWMALIDAVHAHVNQ